MSKIEKKSLPVVAGDDPQRRFESAIAQVQHRSKRPLSQRPIFDRARAAVQGDPATDKQALTDAARALARLWNVSPALVR